MGKIFPTGVTWKFGDERVIGFDPLIGKAYSISISAVTPPGSISLLDMLGWEILALK